MNIMSEALKRANVVTDKDVERVERQKCIEDEEKRKREEQHQINRMIASLNPFVRDAVRNVRKKNPEIMTVSMLEKLSMARKNPLILMDPEVIEAMSYVSIEKMRLDFEEAKQSNVLDKPE